MRKYEDFLLISDLDGTLLATDKSISARTRSALSAFTAGGGCFTIATGRTPANAQDFLEGIPINAPAIFYNGALLADYHTGQLLKSCPLTGPLWRRFVAQCLQDFPEACLEVYTPACCCIVSRPESDDPRLTEEYSPRQYAHLPLAQVEHQLWLKILICATKEVLAKIQLAAVDLGLSQLATSFFSGPFYLEFVGRDVSKGHMLEVLRQLPEYQGRYVVAAGDFPNDNEMLLRADCGVASANAEAETKAVADRVGPSCDEDLWGYIIEELLPQL